MRPSDAPPVLPADEADARAKAYRLHAFLRLKYPDVSLNTCLQAMAVINGQSSWQDMLRRIKAAVLRGTPFAGPAPSADADPDGFRTRAAPDVIGDALGALRDGRNVWLSLPSGSGKTMAFALPASLAFQGHVVYVGSPGSTDGPRGMHLDVVPHAGPPTGPSGVARPGRSDGPPLRCGPFLPKALSILSDDYFGTKARALLLALFADLSKDGAYPDLVAFRDRTSSASPLRPPAALRHRLLSPAAEREASAIVANADLHLSFLTALVASGALSEASPPPDASTRQAILDPDAKVAAYLLDLVLADVVDPRPDAPLAPMLVIVDGRPDVGHQSRLLGDFARVARTRGAAVAWCSQDRRQSPPAVDAFAPFHLS